MMFGQIDHSTSDDIIVEFVFLIQSRYILYDLVLSENYKMF